MKNIFKSWFQEKPKKKVIIDNPFRGDFELLHPHATKIQKECHTFVGQVLEASDKIKDIRQSYNDATCVYYYFKLAELELKIQNLEQKISQDS